MTRTRAKSQPAGSEPQFLGIECGGTRTVALASDRQGCLLRRIELGPANLRLMNDAELAARFRELAVRLPRPDAVGVGMAGARTEKDCRRVCDPVERLWPAAVVWVGNDLESALAAAGATRAKDCAARILVVSGTGSGCLGESACGRRVKVGGWGHVLGDSGSGYRIGHQALREVVQHRELTGVWPFVGRRLLRALQLNEPEDLVAWSLGAGKDEIAALAVEVVAAAREGDRLSRQVLRDAADALVPLAWRCANAVAPPRAAVDFILAGGMFQKESMYVGLVKRRLRRERAGVGVRILAREGAWGALEQAKREWERGRSTRSLSVGPSRVLPRSGTERTEAPASIRLSPTELRNPRSVDLDRRSIDSAIELMLSEDRGIVDALLRERGNIARTVRLVVRAFRRNGRLFYVGAGTSGRLGVLDASECPPTFRADPDQVQGIMAGGAKALWSAVEGAEDDGEAGGRAIRSRGVSKVDVVMGITAGGRTRFVWGALRSARALGASTVLLCFNPHLRFARGLRPDVVIAPDVGPEVLTGSSRLKAGTATKLVLNMITTLSMVRLGKVIGNLMVDLNPSNVKLRDRAVRILRELAAVDSERAEKALEESGWVVKAALRGMKTDRS